MRRGFQRVRTKPEKRNRERKGIDQRDPVLGWESALSHRWALRALLRKHECLCALCGEAVELRAGPLEATIDHVVPLSRGGADTIANMQLAHRRCNRAKGDSVEETIDG